MFFGDGAANQGVLHEALNLSAVWRLPVIFCCENNQYTEWTPTAAITAGRIADRAAPFGIPGEQIDGNDVLAVHEAIGRAVARGRAGEGPSFVECMTYRHHGHNEGEEAFSGKYRRMRSRHSGASATRSRRFAPGPPNGARSRPSGPMRSTPRRPSESRRRSSSPAKVPSLTPTRRCCTASRMVP